MVCCKQGELQDGTHICVHYPPTGLGHLKTGPMVHTDGYHGIPDHHRPSVLRLYPLYLRSWSKDNCAESHETLTSAKDPLPTHLICR